MTTAKGLGIWWDKKALDGTHVPMRQQCFFCVVCAAEPSVNLLWLVIEFDRGLEPCVLLMGPPNSKTRL
jgi:hypothetical protein